MPPDKTILIEKISDVRQTSEIYSMSFKNRHLLEKDGVIKPCGCFQCLKTFKSDEVVNWVDFEETALCPYCATDSVVPYLTDPYSLKIMHNSYFFYSENL